MAQELGILDGYTKPIEDGTVCLVHEEWLKTISTKAIVPKQFIPHPIYSSDEINHLLCQPSFKPTHPWCVIFIKTINKDVKCMKNIRRRQEVDCNPELSFAQIVHYISESNYRNLWKETNSKLCFPHSNAPSSSNHAGLSVKRRNDVIREILKRLYCCPKINLDVDNLTSKPSPIEDDCHINILNAFCIVETNLKFILLHPYLENSLHSCITFSPSLMESSPLKSLFLIYQLLNGVKDIHDRGLHLGNVCLNDLFIDESLWLHVNPKSWLLYDEHTLPDISPLDNASSQTSIANSGLKISDENESLDSMLTSWIHGAISNFDYLMFLNRLAGRKKSNPNYYPVMPWIMDFTVPKGGWRDLTKSKYRLNKGDQQLDLTFNSESFFSLHQSEAEGSTYHPRIPHSQVPHHISDVLSDITYYVYKARCTPKLILCQYVRTKWVPAEYPSSMQRMQEWTPDECIPEFYDDPSIFSSIHDDLPNLEIPSWSSSYEDFIRKHRAALESDHVSRRLNYWIDLTFGHKLIGPAAVSSKNVCLHLVDKHKHLSTSGIVQLFEYPHPRRIFTSPNSKSNRLMPPNFKTRNSKDARSKSKVCSNNEDTLSVKEFDDGTRDSAESPESDIAQTSIKDKKESRSKHVSNSRQDERKTFGDVNSVLPLLQYEAERNFLSKSSLSICDNQKEEILKRGHNKVRDIQVVACLIAELYLAPKLRSLQINKSLHERYEVAHRLASQSLGEIPREVCEILKTLMQTQNPSHELPLHYPSVSEIGLPPPSAHQLLQPLIKGFSFPPYFQDLYSLLSKLKEYSRLILETRWSSNLSDSVRTSLIDSMLESKIKLASNVLSDLSLKLDPEAVDILTPFIKEMLEDPEMSVGVTWDLFSILSPALGPRQSSICFLPSLLKLLSGEGSSQKHLKLFHRTFLLQLIVGLGLKTFLTYFSTLLVEAVSGFKDFGLERKRNPDEADNFSKKGSFLDSPQLQLVESSSDLEASTETNPEISPFKNRYNPPDLEPEIFWLESPTLEKETESFDQSFEDPALEDEISSSPDDFDETDGIELSDNGELELAHSAGLNELKLKYISMKTEDSRTLSASVPAVLHYPRGSPEDHGMSSDPELSFTISDDKSDVKNSDMTRGNTKSIWMSGNSSEYNISDVAMESIDWLAHRLGPVLTSKHLCRNLLRMLPLCYFDKEQVEILPSSEAAVKITISDIEITGDENSKKILHCLAGIATLYGEQIIMLQYLPFVTEQILSCKKRINEMSEAGLLSGMCLLFHIVPYLSDSTLMDHLQDLLLKEILYPAVQLVSSTKLSFPGGSTLRQLISYKLVDVLHLIGLRIGFEMTRKHLSVIIHRFFLSFDRIPEYQDLSNSVNEVSSSARPHNFKPKIEDQYVEIRRNSRNEYIVGSPVTSLETFHKRCHTPPVNNKTIPDPVLNELRGTFTPELASSVYVAFCKLAGGIFMEETLTNDGMIRILCKIHDDQLKDPQCQEFLDNQELDRLHVYNSNQIIASNANLRPANSKFGENVDVVGNRIDLFATNNNQSKTTQASNNPNLPHSTTQSNDRFDITKATTCKMEAHKRHLRGNWLAYWEHEIGCSDKNERFNFKQIKLQTYLGHSNGIKSIHVMDNENSFMTASKDKTVKLWSLRSQGDGSTHSACQLTYNNHRKPVYNITFLDSVRLAGSCDGTVHLWEPFMGSCIKQFENPRNTLTNILVALPPPSRMFAAATTDSTIKFIDARTLKYVHEYKVNITPSGLIRSIGVSPSGNWMAVGHSSGIISVLDLRTGLVSGIWKGHEGEVLQLKVFNENMFVSSSLDYMMTTWNRLDKKPRFHLKGNTEPVTCFNFFHNQVVTGTTANRIGVHTSIDAEASYTSIRLRSDTFKGVLTSMAILPLNKLLLLGSDSGTVSLLC